MTTNNTSNNNPYLTSYSGTPPYGVINTRVNNHNFNVNPQHVVNSHISFGVSSDNYVVNLNVNSRQQLTINDDIVISRRELGAMVGMPRTDSGTSELIKNHSELEDEEDSIHAELSFVFRTIIAEHSPELAARIEKFKAMCDEYHIIDKLQKE